MSTFQDLSKNQVKLIRSLAIKKYRNKNNLFIAEGKKVIEELINSSFIIEKCFIINDFSHQKIDHCKQIISKKDLNEISLLQQPHFGLALVQIPKTQFQATVCTNIVLDGISDPGNFGTIIRLADWYGIDQIICTNNCVDAYNPKVVQASMGSIFRVNISVQNISEIPWNENVYGAFLEGENVHYFKTSTPFTLVIGSEAEGICQEIADFCKNKITIPRIGKAESLNAGIATAIILDRLTQN